MVYTVPDLVYGAGINDLPKLSRNEFYRAWLRMLERCYGAEYQRKFPTYVGCSVCDDWLKFSSFKSWMEKQDWKNNRLDKDIIKKWNKVYCPEFSSFVSPATNGFVIGDLEPKGEFMIGVTFHDRAGRFRARCRNPFSKKEEYLGLFDDELSAHNAWLNRKNQMAMALAEIQSDPRVSKALACRYQINVIY